MRICSSLTKQFSLDSHEYVEYPCLAGTMGISYELSYIQLTPKIDDFVKKIS